MTPEQEAFELRERSEYWADLYQKSGAEMLDLINDGKAKDARIAALEAEVQALREDAARMAFLRSSPFRSRPSPTVRVPILEDGRWVSERALVGDEVDAAIDAARAAGGEG